MGEGVRTAAGVESRGGRAPSTRFTVAHRYDAASDGARGCSSSYVLTFIHLRDINFVNTVTMLHDSNICPHRLQQVEVGPRLAAVSPPAEKWRVPQNCPV
jgi:hypothetical protein